MNLTKFEEQLFRRLKTQPETHAHHCARNSLIHLEKAYLLQKVDNEMAAFRLITAEEEIAAAIFRSCQDCKYKGADRLRPGNHVQKNALYPFVQAVRFSMVYLDHAQIKVSLDVSFQEGIRLRVHSHNIHPKIDFSPHPPLNFSVSGTTQDDDINDALNRIATGSGCQSIREYLKKSANLRNRVLYASPKGVPAALNLESALPKFRQTVFSLLVLYLMISEHKVVQQFVQENLIRFLKVVDIVKRDKTIQGLTNE